MCLVKGFPCFHRHRAEAFHQGAIAQEGSHHSSVSQVCIRGCQHNSLQFPFLYRSGCTAGSRATALLLRKQSSHWACTGKSPISARVSKGTNQHEILSYCPEQDARQVTQAAISDCVALRGAADPHVLSVRAVVLPPVAMGTVQEGELCPHTSHIIQQDQALASSVVPFRGQGSRTTRGKKQNTTSDSLQLANPTEGPKFRPKGKPGNSPADISSGTGALLT